jgi:hypothetical protein
LESFFFFPLFFLNHSYCAYHLFRIL